MLVSFKIVPGFLLLWKVIKTILYVIKSGMHHILQHSAQITRPVITDFGESFTEAHLNAGCASLHEISDAYIKKNNALCFSVNFLTIFLNISL